MVDQLDRNALIAVTGSKREKPVVLHVDDDVASLMMAEGALEDAGFDVVQASDGMEAIERFHERAPDLIIMDAIMPRMDGFEAIAAIRELPQGAHVPILMITGLDDLSSITRAYDEGATDFLTKPVNFFILPHRVQYMLRSKNTADALRSSQAKLDNAQRIARLGHWECEVATGALTWSREFGRILGAEQSKQLVHWNEFLSAVDEDQRQSLKLVANQSVNDCTAFTIEFRLNGTAGGERTIRLEAEPYIADNGDFSHMLGTIQDITERTDAQAQIHNLAYYDLVTGLPNRAQLHERLHFVLQNAERAESQFALLFLDLDHFKQVNDTLGHDAGDDLLKQVSERLTAVVRDSDSVVRTSEEDEDDLAHQHTVARLGGDEFVVLLGQVNRAEDAARVAQRIAATISEPYAISDNEVSVTTTIGISVYPADGTDSETLMKHADVAMYHAKEQGRNGYQFYSRGIHEQALARFSMERELKTAIENDELMLVYQPKIDFQDGRVVGVEALVRWEHPDNGVVSPAEFIPLAEETGLILPLGQWVLKEGCAQMQRWIDRGVGPFSMAVNCSSVQFTRGDMIGDLQEAIRSSGLDPRWLEVELTESLLIQDIDAGIESLQEMKQLGIQISIDDFGTGFSSLSYLKRLPVDKLKIDQSFVKDLGFDQGDAAIVSAIITLSHNLNLTVVAEGVETQEQFDILRDFRCNEAQGYLISYPMNSADFEIWLKNWQSQNNRQVVGF